MFLKVSLKPLTCDENKDFFVSQTCFTFLILQTCCQCILLFVVSDHSIAFHLQPLTSLKDMNTTYDALLYKRCTEWQKYPAGNIRGSCNSCDRTAASKLTSLQSGPPRITGLAWKPFAMLLFLPHITHTFSALVLFRSAWLTFDFVLQGETSKRTYYTHHVH